MNPILCCQDLCCRRTTWNETSPATIQDITASFDAGIVCEFDGPDGPGKTLLLSVLGLLERADSGSLSFEGQSVNDLTEEDLQRCRNRSFGFLFQNPCLLPSFSVAENVAMPLFRICGTDASLAHNRTTEVLDFCKIAHLENVLAGRLNPSAQRRAALARALVHRPKVLVALSVPETSDLFELAARTAEEFGLCVLWAKEDGEPSGRAQRRIQIREGRITSDQLL
jgi:ABC-type lipoprotein export system ATPase subunit